MNKTHEPIQLKGSSAKSKKKTRAGSANKGGQKPGSLLVSKTVQNSSSSQRYSLLNVWVISVFLKILLSIGYHSTDFEVHRNWLAITYHLPMNEWYTNKISQWTLDYPPCFAYFEWVLSHLVPAVVRDDGCLDLVEKGTYGAATIFYQRLTVIVSELVLFFALQWYINSSKDRDEARRAYVVASSLVLSPGLLIIDHMHFQYNGMMYGILVLVINNARLKNYLSCGFWFSLLLCFKHIYLYLAPAVFVFLLRGYCLNLKFNRNKTLVYNLFNLINWCNSIKLGAVVISVFGLSFAPFVYFGQMPQVFERLFPFSRGLTHAYWAPNFWAIYSFCDRLLIAAYNKAPITRTALISLFKFNPEYLKDSKLVNTSTRGIVGDIEFLILPTITPKLTFLLTLFYQIMPLIPLFIQPNFPRFVGSLSLCGFASFLFGWHVHEKAILLVIFPISFLVVRDTSLLTPFNLLVSCGYVSLFPLIFTSSEWTTKVLYTFLWYLIYAFNFRNVTKIPNLIGHEFILERFTNLYILGLLIIIGITSIIDLLEHQIEVLKRLEFLKLILISVYCGLGIIGSWNGFSWSYFVNDSIFKED